VLGSLSHKEPKLLAGAGAGAVRNFGSNSSSETGIPTKFLFTKRALYEKKYSLLSRSVY
jgi:hypothetical protein